MDELEQLRTERNPPIQVVCDSCGFGLFSYWRIPENLDVMYCANCATPRSPEEEEE